MPSVALPPGPPLPLFVQTLLWVYRPTWWLERCARMFQGGAFQVQLAGGNSGVVLTDPAAIAELFAQGPDATSAGKANGILRPLVGDHSLLLLDGAPHARERKLMMPPFHGERMRTYATTIRDITRASIERWPLGKPFVLHSKLQDLTLEVILKVVLGITADDADAQALRRSLKQTLDFTRRPSLLLTLRTNGSIRAERLQRWLGPIAPLSRFEKLRRETDTRLFAEIRRRRAEANTEREDIVSLLLSTRDESGASMTDQEIRDQIMTLLVAGHETTATALSSTLSELIQHPEANRRALEELHTEVGAGALEAPHLPRLRYLDAVLSESLRLRPVLPIVARLLEKPLTLGGHELPSGTLVYPCIYLAHRRKEVFPSPDEFRPERFLEGTPNPASYFPFGGGNRRCLGRAFSLFEMKVVLAQVLLQTKLRFAPGYRPKVVRRSITLALSRGVPVVAG